MRLRLLNDVLLVEPDQNLVYKGRLVMPQNNSQEKISPFVTVHSASSHCTEKFNRGDRLWIERFKDKPKYQYYDGKKLRMIHEHYIHARIEDD